MEKPSKLRLVFDRKILSKYQRLEGLKHSWISLKPKIKTISDLQSHVQKSFCLDKKCPNGVVLYMDGFVLPPFESTCMLHESDIISVGKKDNAQMYSIEVGDAITEAREKSDGQKQKVNEVLCMDNENGIQTDSYLNSKKKRKYSDKIPTPNETVNDKVGGSKHDHTNGNMGKPINNWNWPANKKEQNYGSVNKWNQANAPSNYQYCNKNQKSGNKWIDRTNNNNQNYAKNSSYKWNLSNNNCKEPCNKTTSKCNGAENSEVLGSGNTSKWDAAVNNIEKCNGTTSKWNDVINNTEQCTGNTSKWDGALSNKELCNGTASKWNEVINNREQCRGNTSKWDNALINYEQSNGKEIVHLNEKNASSPIDFESLFPLKRFPQVRDLIAYRLIEMASSWCPSITPFRIGEVASYNNLTLNIVLVPLREYPIFTNNTQKSSLYNEDGTLQTHYPSLIDVRLFRAYDSFDTSSESFEFIEREKNPQIAKTALVDKWEQALIEDGINAKEIVAQPIENENASWGPSSWDKYINNEKRSEIDEDKKDEWGEWTSSQSTTSSPWKNGWSEWNGSSQGSQQAGRGRGMRPTYGSFRGGRGRRRGRNCNVPSL